MGKDHLESIKGGPDKIDNLAETEGKSLRHFWSRLYCGFVLLRYIMLLKRS